MGADGDLRVTGEVVDHRKICVGDHMNLVVQRGVLTQPPLKRTTRLSLPNQMHLKGTQNLWLLDVSVDNADGSHRRHNPVHVDETDGYPNESANLTYPVETTAHDGACRRQVRR